MEAFAREYGLSYAVATEIITLGRAIGNIRAAVASGEHGDVTDVVKEAFAIVNNKNINKHMAVYLNNEIACPVRMICLG